MKGFRWSALWSLMGLAAMFYSWFAPPDHADFIFMLGLVAIIRGDVLAIREEIAKWRAL
jgi:hypothetical protein